MAPPQAGNVLLYVPDNGRGDTEVTIDQYGRQVGSIIIYTPTPEEYLTAGREEMEAELSVQESWAPLPDDALAASQGAVAGDSAEEAKAREDDELDIRMKERAARNYQVARFERYTGAAIRHDAERERKRQEAIDSLFEDS